MLPLRSDAIRKARQVDTWQLAIIFAVYSSGAVISTVASALLWGLRPWMSPIVFLELWALPLDALTFLNLAFIEFGHIAEEMTAGGMMLDSLVSAVKQIVNVCHRIAVLCYFSLCWRVADLILLSEICLSSRRVLLNARNHLKHSAAYMQAYHSYSSISSGSLLLIQV